MQYASIYIHIPFCIRKCNYCDFVSFPVNKYPPLIRQYANYIDREIELWARQEDLSQVETVYVGGGTPTVLATGDLLHIVSNVLSYCRISQDNEVTVEANPGTIDAKNLQRLRQAGVNRLSVGAESFNNKSLEAMGRTYRAKDTIATLRDARNQGFDNISIDLIYGLPDQTLEEWREDLYIALDQDIDHISIYGLTLSDKTPWGKAAAQGRLNVADQDLSADMLEGSINIITKHGFEHYEVSNFAKPGFQCRHNLGYWQRKDYLGLGVAAASAVGNHRFSNFRTLEEYTAHLDKNNLPIDEEEILSQRQVLSEAMFLGLRLLKGIDMTAFKKRYFIRPDVHFKTEIEDGLKKGLLEISGDTLRLTHKGLFLANEVFMSFL